MTSPWNLPKDIAIPPPRNKNENGCSCANAKHGSRRVASRRLGKMRTAASATNSAAYFRVASAVLAQLQPFCGDGIFVDRKAGCVAARLRQTLDIASPDRIGDTGEHNRHGACRFQQRSNGGAGRGEKDIGSERHQFGCVSAHRFRIADAPTIVDADVLAYRPAQLLQALRE